MPFLGLGLLLTIIAAGFRGMTIFFPGLTGMLVGGVLGWICGRIGRDDPEKVWSFGNRVGLTLGATMLYSLDATQIRTLSVDPATPEC